MGSIVQSAAAACRGSTVASAHEAPGIEGVEPVNREVVGRDVAAT